MTIFIYLKNEHIEKSTIYSFIYVFPSRYIQDQKCQQHSKSMINHKKITKLNFEVGPIKRKTNMKLEICLLFIFLEEEEQNKQL